MRVVGEMAPDYFASSYARHFWPEQCGGRTSLESCTKQRYTPSPSHPSRLSANVTTKWAGARAAQVVPHVHFHIIPRPPLVSADAMAASPSWTMFGRGRREDLDDDEGEELARLLREELAREVKRVKQEEGVDLDVDRDYRL